MAAERKSSSLYVGYGHNHKQKYHQFEPETVLGEIGNKLSWMENSDSYILTKQ